MKRLLTIISALFLSLGTAQAAPTAITWGQDTTVTPPIVCIVNGATGCIANIGSYASNVFKFAGDGSALTVGGTVLQTIISNNATAVAAAQTTATNAGTAAANAGTAAANAQATANNAFPASSAGTAATKNVGVTGGVALFDDIRFAAALQKLNNLSDVQSPSTALANIGGVSAATVAATYAPLNSPAFTGTPTAPTQITGDVSNKIATNQFVGNAVAAIPQSISTTDFRTGLVESAKYRPFIPLIGGNADSFFDQSGTDVIDPLTKVQMHFDSTVTADDLGHTVTTVGTPTINTINPKFGAGALSLNGSSYLNIAPVNADLTLASTNTWTVEGWFYPTTFAASNEMFSSSGLNAYLDTSGRIVINNGSTGNYTSTAVATINTWNKIELDCNVGTCYVFLNGNYINTFAMQATAGGGPIYISSYVGSSGFFTGLIDEFRVSIGVNRHNTTTTSYTPETIAFNANTSSGYYYDSINKLYANVNFETIQSLPAMTSATAPSGTITASTTYQGSESPYYAYDQLLSTDWLATAGTPQWIQRNTTSAIKLSSYAITARNDTYYLRTPYTWTFLGSNDGTNWTTLDSRTAIPFNQGQRQVFTIAFPNRANYSYHRLNITASQPSSDGYISIGELDELQQISGLLDLRSVSFPTTYTPTKGSIFLIVNPLLGTITPNTNLIAYLSQNGSTATPTYTTTPLTLSGTTVAGYPIYESNNVTLPGTGSQLRWRVQTPDTSVLLQVRGVYFQEK